MPDCTFRANSARFSVGSWNRAVAGRFRSACAFLLTDYGNIFTAIFAFWGSQMCFCGTKTPRKPAVFCGSGSARRSPYSGDMERCSKPRLGAFVLLRTMTNPTRFGLAPTVSPVGLRPGASELLGTMANISMLDDDHRCRRWTPTRDDPWTRFD